MKRKTTAKKSLLIHLLILFILTALAAQANAQGCATPSFAAPTNFGVGSVPYSVITGDFNGDSKLDLATANNGSDNVSVRLNNCTPNTAPAAVDDSFNTDEDTALDVAAPGVIDDDTDNEMDSLSASLVSGQTDALAFNLNADGSFSYTPNADFNGQDIFTYKVNDGSLDSNTATVTITVSEVNDAPTASGDSDSTDEDTTLMFDAADLTANDSTGPANESSQNLSVTMVITTANTHGQVSLNNGQITYQPDANYNGAASFDYKVCDDGTTGGNADPQCATGTVNVTMNAVNDAPTISGGTISRQQDAGASSSQIATVGDVEDAANTLSVTVNGGTTATVNGVTVSGIAFDSNDNVTANVSAACGASNASFTLKVTDSGNLMMTATFNVSVTLETTPPVINPYSDIVVTLPANSNATSMVVSFPTPTASDNCDANVTVTTSPASGSVFPVGTTTVTVNAVDDAGNTASTTFTVSVQYNFTGFFNPVDPDEINLVKAGSSVPIKFSLSGNKGMNIFAPNSPTSQQVDCTTGALIGSPETISTNGGGLKYADGSDQYHLNWKTSKSYQGQCRRLVVLLNDSTERTADFQFK